MDFVDKSGFHVVRYYRNKGAEGDNPHEPADSRENSDQGPQRPTPSAVRDRNFVQSPQNSLFSNNISKCLNIQRQALILLQKHSYGSDR